MLYIMGESWYWIKQRPHFLAEHLSRYYDIDLVFEKRYTKRVENDLPINIKCHEIFKLPKAHNPLIKKVNEFLTGRELKRIYREKKYDVVLFNSYNHFKMLKDITGKEDFVIYDCMDDFTEFEGAKRSDEVLNKIKENEKTLYRRCNLAIFSSDYLMERIKKRYGEKDNTAVINNAIEILNNENQEPPESLKEMFSISMRNICYIGSVSEWFDFDIVIKALDRFKDLNFILVGPSDTEIPKHERLRWHGQTGHENVMGVMRKADLLVMPFIVNELVKSVNPVKLYEYIYSGTPALAVKYGETEKFGDYVYLYENEEEFFGWLEKMRRGELIPLKNISEAESFAKDNTWKMRAAELNGLITEFMGS